MQKIIAELRDVAKLDRIGQGAIQYAQAGRVLQQVLENAASLQSDALLDAFGGKVAGRGRSRAIALEHTQSQRA